MLTVGEEQLDTCDMAPTKANPEAASPVSGTISQTWCQRNATLRSVENMVSNTLDTLWGSNKDAQDFPSKSGTWKHRDICAKDTKSVTATPELNTISLGDYQVLGNVHHPAKVSHDNFQIKTAPFHDYYAVEGDIGR